MNAKAKVQTILILALLFPVIHPTEGLAKEIDPSSETVILADKVQIPVVVDGKEVGKTSLPAGTKVTVLSRDGARVSIKLGNLGPVWVEASQLSGLSDKKPEQPSKPVKSDPAIDLQRLTRLVSEKQWAQVAAVCETIAQADEKFSGLAELAGQLRSALQAQGGAVEQQRKAEAEAKRLRRNADVVGQPSRLNPGDRSPMERAQKLREQADGVIEEAKDTLEASEVQIAQVGTDISSELSRLESDAQQKRGEDKATAKLPSNDPPKTSGGHDTDTENKKKMELQAAMLVLDWPIRTHTHQEALQDIQESMTTGILPKLGLTFEECVKNCPVDPKKTHQENLQIQKKLAIQLERGWTKSSFRCGDILTVVAFDESDTVADVRYSHMKNALKCSDDGLLNALCSYNEPSAAWLRFEPKGQMNGGIAMGGDPDKPVAVMSAEASEVYLSTPRAQAFWNAKKATRSALHTPRPEMDTDTSSDSKVSVDTQAANESEKEPSAFRRGPRIHGFQLGMTLDEFRTALRAARPQAREFDWGQRGFGMKSRDPVFSPLLSEHSNVEALIYREASEKGSILGSVLVVGPSRIVISLTLTFAVLDTVFDANGLDWRDFCQEIINAYKIPELVPSGNSMVHRSGEGWTISLTPNRGLDLMVAPRKEPKEPIDPAARGFGG